MANAAQGGLGHELEVNCEETENWSRDRQQGFINERQLLCSEGFLKRRWKRNWGYKPSLLACSVRPQIARYSSRSS